MNTSFATNKKSQALKWVKEFKAHCYICKFIETGGNGYPGHDKYRVVVLNPGLEIHEFERRLNAILRNAGL